MRVLFAILVASLNLAAGGFDELLRYAHPDAQFLCGLEWSSIARSELATSLKSELATGKSDLHGFEFVGQLDRAVISSPGKKNPRSAQSVPLLVVLSGKFNLDELRKRSVSKRVKGVEWLTPKDGKEEMEVAALSPGLLLVGDAKSLLAALERGPATHTGGLFASAAALSATHPLWVAAISPSTLTKTSGMASAFAQEIRSITGGMQFDRGLDFDLFLNTTGPEQAGKLMLAMQTMMTLQLASANNTPGPADLLRRLRLAQNGAQVRMTLSVGTKEIQTALQGFKKGFSQGFRAAASGQPVTIRTASLPPAPPEKKVIRIIGLDEGPREIPFSN